MPALIPDAVEEALASKRKTSLFGFSVYVVSLGHLIAMKLMAERKKDIADVVELIKVSVEEGHWADDCRQVESVVKKHLGWYAARAVNDLAKVAKTELGR